MTVISKVVGMRSLYAAVDLNGDGRIDFNEFVHWQLSRYESERRRGDDDRSRSVSRAARRWDHNDATCHVGQMSSASRRCQYDRPQPAAPEK